MIEITKLNKIVKHKPILRNINLEIKDGERVALIGSNGSGKTTLIETILNIQKKTSGKVDFKFEYQHSPTEKMGVQFQDANFPVGLTTKRLIEFFKLKALNRDEKYIEKLIDKFGVKEFLETDASKLSGGQAQKLNILLALINKPQILILDELTTGLDVSARNIIRAEVMDYINENKDLTLILITHIPAEIEEFCNRIVRMENGKIVEDFKVKDLTKKHKTVSDYMDTIK